MSQNPFESDGSEGEKSTGGENVQASPVEATEDEQDEQDELEGLDYDGASALVEVYRVADDLSAGLVIDEVLAPAGIPAVTHDRRSHALPAPASMPGAIGIAVPEELAERAREVLREARRDGVLLDDGYVVDDAPQTA